MSNKTSADLALIKGKVVMVDKEFHIAQAATIAGGRFIAVGTREQVQPLITSDTRVIDLQGRTVIPGLTDAHMHVNMLGGALANVPLFEIDSIKAILAKLKATLPDLPAGLYLFGKGEAWHPRQMKEGRLPDRRDLDQVSMDIPVLIGDVNKLIVNTKTLELAGITRDSAAPARGAIDIDPQTGEPTGVFWSAARSLIWDHLPAMKEDPRANLLRTSQACREVGLTTLVDAGSTLEAIDAYRQVDREGKLDLRLRAMPRLPLDADLAPVEELREELEAAGGNLRIGPLKLMFDGGVMWRTAYMFAHYQNEPDNVGSTLVEPEKLKARIFEAHQRGWSIGIHCTGDRALELAVGYLAEAIERWPDRTVRHSAIHGYFPTERTLDLMASANIIAAVQPRFLYAWGETVIDHLGPCQAERFKPLRTYLGQGIVLAGGSDAAVASYNPFLGMEAAVSRRLASGKVLGVEEAITIEEVLRAYTVGGAYLTFEENLRGSIEVGKLADFVILDRDLLSIAPDEIGETKALLTCVGGKIVHNSLDL